MKRSKLHVLGAAAVTVAFASAAAFSGIVANAAAPEPEAQPPAVIPEADQYGVIHASSWADQYPLEYASYLANAANVPPEYAQFLAEGGVDTTSVGTDLVEDFTSDKANYLDADHYPEILTLGKGYGYCKYYTEPAGHTYSLWTVAHNGRLGPLPESKGKIGCYSCKTPQVHYADDMSDDPTTFYTQGISDWADAFDENISCSNCHENENPTQMNVLRDDWVRAMGEDLTNGSVPMESIVCGQCHCDYSMAPVNPDDPFDDGEPISPYYGGTDSMTPDSALAFYDEYGFADWTYASTGAKMIAARHAEFEFNYGGDGAIMANMGYTCADCHMGVKVADDGTAYTSHTWVSPLDDEEILAGCDTCHGDTVAKVQDIQADIDGRTHELGLRAEQFVLDFESVVAKPDENGTLVFDMDTALANGLTEEQVADLQYIQRAACFYWNYAAADNSEGAHNTALYNYLIDAGNAQLDAGYQILDSLA